jgi:hypothetical protein
MPELNLQTAKFLTVGLRTLVENSPEVQVLTGTLVLNDKGGGSMTVHVRMGTAKEDEVVVYSNGEHSITYEGGRLT